MISSYSRAAIQTDPLLLRTMHEDRKRVFVDMLRWRLPHDSAQEQDQFDVDGAIYLAAKDKTGSHRVSVRLLDTERPHIVGSIFPFLCQAPLPRGPHVKEITRYIASPRARATDRLIARNMMARGLAEYAHLHGITTYTAVCDISFLSQILAAGWRCDPLGLPQPVDGSVIGAFCIHIEADTIKRMARSWRYLRPALVASELRVAA